MELKWCNPDAEFERLVLAIDVGGTNTNIGLVAYKEGKFTLVMKADYASGKISGLESPIAETLRIAAEKRPDLKPSHCCISAAGPVAENRCVMTNLTWKVDGEDLTAKLGFPVMVVNDFVAISYGIPTLNVNDAKQIYKMPHLDGFTPDSKPATKVVIGPGTGMGVSFLVYDGKKYIPASSEGGHITFAPFDADSQDFRDYMQKRIGQIPGVEPLCAGQGLAHLYEWWRDTRGVPDNEAFRKIEATVWSDRPKYISRASDTDPVAAEMMRLWVKMLARYASDVCAMFLPFGGFYLAGGAMQKDLRWLLNDNLFMKFFEQNYNPNILPLLKKMPVYVIKDYSISLYGAANASVNLQE